MSSCKNEDKKNVENGAIARAYDQYLYANQLDISNINNNSADSINSIYEQINNWLSQQIIAEQAQQQLPAAIQSEIEQKVANYKNELYSFAYEKQMAVQKMDTLIADSIIDAYYNHYISSYILEEPYLRFIYVKCDKKEFVSEVESWIKDTIDLHNLEDFCKEELQVCHLYPDKWVSYKQFQNKLSEVDLNQKKIKSGNAYFKIKEDNVHYLLRVLEFKDKGKPAPLSFVKNDIKTILLNKKKVDFLINLKQSLLQKELDNGNAKIFE